MRLMRPKSKKIKIFYLVALDQSIKLGLRLFYPYLLIINSKGALGILPSWVSLLGWLGLGFWLIKYRSKSKSIYLVIAGGLSNLLDRLFWGGVVDFISISPFPSFNLADMMITIGVLLIFYQELNLKKNAKI